jgi:hypothetical protein
VRRLELLDSARHKLQLAAYHRRALLNVLELHPSEELEDERRIEMEAHLEGLAYTGTAAAEKTLRSIDPEALSAEQMSVERMIRIVRTEGRPPEEREFASRFNGWWFAEEQVAVVARDLRNDAAHRVYEKAPDGPLWRMDIGQRTVPLADFAERYSAHLESLVDLVERAEQLAGAHAG